MNRIKMRIKPFSHQFNILSIQIDKFINIYFYKA
ncbi:unnamed protein product [Paramecium octaurelia]|uniref:Uncharacterized protein n=1 Tax=Paramecium octaurelia TaxID=43137 RepID=A0A8S1S3J9_PAROT|nr:unnamed protein product [Paramecium octaurelia]